MSIPKFHQTRMGDKFYTHDVPQLNKHLSGIRTELSRANDLKERELNLADTLTEHIQTKNQTEGADMQTEQIPAITFENLNDYETVLEYGKETLTIDADIRNPFGDGEPELPAGADYDDALEYISAVITIVFNSKTSDALQDAVLDLMFAVQDQKKLQMK